MELPTHKNGVVQNFDNCRNVTSALLAKLFILRNLKLAPRLLCCSES
jgi:hypothetical protein